MTRANILDTGTASYLELIGNGKTYRVPPYQRDYAWTQQEWEDLWNDVVEMRGDPEGRHYMGALVVQTHGDREFLVIDGQQRLATISLLALAVIRKLRRMADGGADQERNRERAAGLRNRFIGEKDPASLVESSRLHLNETDDSFYQDYLVQLEAPLNPRGLPQSSALLWKCYRYFSRQIDQLFGDAQDNGEDIAQILSETVARRLLFILITVDRRAQCLHPVRDAQRPRPGAHGDRSAEELLLFESANAKRRRLAEAALAITDRDRDAGGLSKFSSLPPPARGAAHPSQAAVQAGA